MSTAKANTINLTPRSRQALETARELASGLGHSHIGSQHLVFGLFKLGSGVHYSVLRSFGFSDDSLREAIASEPPVHTDSAAPLELDRSATAVLDRAEAEARAMGHGYTGTEHILLALLAEQAGGAANLFASRGIDLLQARQMILHEYGMQYRIELA